MPTARLGGSADIAVTAATNTTIDGSVPAGLAPGVYALTVTNPDLQSATLPAAYTVLGPGSPNATLGTGYLVTFGPAAPGDAGDDDHAQVIFFEVPASYGGDLYLRIFDADVGGGGMLDPVDETTDLVWDTTMTYTLRCGNSAYTPPARTAHPSQGGIDSGTLLAQTAVGANPAHHNTWGLVLGPYSTAGCEIPNSSSAIFKLTVQGASGNDGNYYNAALSTVAGDNIPPSGTRIFAYSWTFALASDVSQRPALYPYVPAGTSTLEQYNWDLDYAGGVDTMTLHTPIRDLIVPGSGMSGNSVTFPGDAASSSHTVGGGGESGTTWTVTLEFASGGVWNDLTLWAVGDGGDLPIFTQPTTVAPP
jgi:hypothetical protein